MGNWILTQPGAESQIYSPRKIAEEQFAFKAGGFGRSRSFKALGRGFAPDDVVTRDEGGSFEPCTAVLRTSLDPDGLSHCPNKYFRTLDELDSARRTESPRAA